jgi:hypothetical protein
MKMRTLIDGLCCVDLINPIGVVTGVWRQTSSFYWTHLSRFRLEGETESTQLSGFSP